MKLGRLVGLAFVDEHADDVGKLGIFIKSSAPTSPPGTLIKLELKCADGAVALSGVGRIVWQERESGATTPQGFGVKLIKLDPASVDVRDRMLARQSGSGGRSLFDAGWQAHGRPGGVE